MAMHPVGIFKSANGIFEFKQQDNRVFALYSQGTQPTETYEVDRHSVVLLSPADASTPLHVIVHKLITNKYIPSIQGGKLIWTPPPVRRVEELLLHAEQYMKQQQYLEAAGALLEAQQNAACVSDPFGEANFLEKIERKIVQDLIEKTKDPRIEFLLLQKDAVRMTFEASLNQLSACSGGGTPTCFICFSIEKDVADWLEHTFVPDLDRIGVLPLFCFRQLGPGKDLNPFQEQIRTSDLVVLICTHDLKRKCIERESAPFGVAQEIRMAKERFNDRDKKESNFAVYLRGDVQSTCPAPILEPIFHTNLTIFENNCSSAFYSYYSQMFEFFGELRKIPRPDARKIKGAFYDATRKILVEKIIPEEQVVQWRLARAHYQKTIELSNSNPPSFETIQKMYAGLDADQVDIDGTLQRLEKTILEDEYRQKEHSLYIETDCSYGFGVMNHQQESDLQLKKAFDSFLSGPKKVMVLQAFAGSGKTMFTQKIEEELLKEFLRGNPQARIPLRIELGGLVDPVGHAMDEGLRNKGFSDAQIQRLKTMPVLIILDGVDEARYENKRLSPTHHLFFTNKLYEWKNAKVVFGLRIGGSHEGKVNVNQFRSYRNESNSSIEGENLMEGVIICPFSKKKIERYIGQYTEKAPVKWKQNYGRWIDQNNALYFSMIKSIRGAAELAAIPFTLRLLTEFLPLIVESATQNTKSFDATTLKITESQMYEVFLSHWFIREQQKRVGHTLPEEFSGQDPTEFAWSYCMHLAKEMSLEGEDHVGITQVIYRKAIPFARRLKSDERWDKYFSDDPVALVCNRLSPLKKTEQGSQVTYSFIHPYIQDFLVARLSAIEGSQVEEATL